MTYPPQQPGRQGPQQGPYGPPPARGGYGTPPGGFGSPQAGPGGPGGPGGFGPPPGGPGGPGGAGDFPPGPPQKGRKGLWFGIGGAVLVVAVLLVTGLAAPGWMLGGSSPQDVANRAMTAFSQLDVATMNSVSCDQKSPQDVAQLRDRLQHAHAKVEASLDGDMTEQGDKATVPVTVKITATVNGETRTLPKHATLTLKKQDGDWCVDDLSAAGDSE